MFRKGQRQVDGQTLQAIREAIESDARAREDIRRAIESHDRAFVAMLVKRVVGRLQLRVSNMEALASAAYEWLKSEGKL